MAVFKCKMCGYSLDVNENTSIITCEACGSKQTVPTFRDELTRGLYDRASHFRRNNEFDKALGIYEQILNEYPNDAESYWSIVLCQYGITYVDDPKTGNKIPTINRVQYQSIYDDDNFKMALKYASGEQKVVYEHEAKLIDGIQKQILDISKKEKPFDIFICFKQSDDNGNRTKDYVAARKIYDLLTSEGYKVFFAPVTLQDKLGLAYEPYIFSALNSAKLMLVVTCNAEYANAPWVRNEWSRYLNIIKKDNSKKLFVIYKDVNLYDLPTELASRQALNMDTLGYDIDLKDAVKKILGSRTSSSSSSSVRSNDDALLKRARIFLDNEDWGNAKKKCDELLDKDPENALGYLYLLLADLHIKDESDLSSLDRPLSNMANYKNALRFADNEMAHRLEGYNKVIEDRIERAEQARLAIKLEEEKKSAFEKKKQETLEPIRRRIENIKEEIKNNNQTISNYENRINDLRNSGTGSSGNNSKKYVSIAYILLILFIFIGYISFFVFSMNNNVLPWSVLVTAAIIPYFILGLAVCRKKGLGWILSFICVILTNGIAPLIIAIINIVSSSKGEVSKKEIKRQIANYEANIESLKNKNEQLTKELSEQKQKLKQTEESFSNINAATGGDIKLTKEGWENAA